MARIVRVGEAKSHPKNKNSKLDICPNNDFSGLSKQTLIEFIRKGIIVESDDELISQLQYQHCKTLFSTDTLNLTIAPTMACNFACSYCYEN